MPDKTPTATAPTIIVSRLDCDRIESLLDTVEQDRPDTGANVKRLRAELARAELREPADMPDDVITMNSTARFRDEASGEEREMTLVYPRDADGSGQRVSILAPVGSALLGLRVGQVIDWPMPSGTRVQLRALGIHYQPEAAGEFHR